jgi:DNA (cytosine-5)-methyltransferase 1
MRYLSVCSGIEAASVAWESFGWTPIAFAEIERFPSQVLAHRFPGVPNLGDMTRYKDWDIDRDAVDLIVGGTPCQSFSVAGLRKGLEDPRGNLALTFLGMVDHYRPEWVVWENVPGVLSSSGGRDFGSFLGALGQLGYGFAYRVLDAQYFGVPQRRRRVFVVAHSSGDSRRAAQVLFEPESLRGNPPKSRTSGKDTAQCLTTGTDCRYDPETETLIPVMYENHPNDSRVTGPVSASPTVAARWGTGGGNTPLVQHTFRKSRRAQSTEDFETWVPDNVTNTLNCFDVGDIRSTDIVVQPVMYSVREDAKANTFSATESEVANCIQSTQSATTSHHAINYIVHPPHTFKVRGLGHYTGTNGGVAKPGTGGSGYMGQDEKAYTVACTQDQHLMQGMAVRRLTPVECERLQGFPDGWTDILATTPDGPRYKAIGNSMAVPVMRWIGSRIQACR